LQKSVVILFHSFPPLSLRFTAVVIRGFFFNVSRVITTIFIYAIQPQIRKAIHFSTQVPFGPSLSRQHNTSSSLRHLGPLHFCNLSSIFVRPSMPAWYKTYVQSLVRACRNGPPSLIANATVSPPTVTIFFLAFFFHTLLFVLWLNRSQSCPSCHVVYNIVMLT
jgi:hypothetical protein